MWLKVQLKNRNKNQQQRYKWKENVKLSALIANPKVSRQLFMFILNALSTLWMKAENPISPGNAILTLLPEIPKYKIPKYKFLSII